MCTMWMRTISDGFSGAFLSGFDENVMIMFKYNQMLTATPETDFYPYNIVTAKFNNVLKYYWNVA